MEQTHSGLPFCENARLHIRSSLLRQCSELAFSYHTSCSLFVDVYNWRANSSPEKQICNTLNIIV